MSGSVGHRGLLLGGGGTAWDELVASLSPALWLKFDEASGTVANDSGPNNLDGTYNGGAGVTLDRPAIYPGMGKCARFGAGYARVPNNAALQFTTQNFAVGIAFKRDGTTGRGQYGKLIWKTTNYTNGHANYLLKYTRDTNKVAGRVSYSGQPYFDTPASTTTFADATAYLVFLRRLGDKLSLWVNGAKETENTLPSPTTALTTSADPVDIMGGPGSSTDPIVGFGDEALIIPGTVSDATMAALWAARN